MRVLQSLIQMTRARRWAPLLGAMGLIALCSGCVVYAGGGGYGPHWHGGGYYHYR
jgi:hypothetical protein